MEYRDPTPISPDEIDYDESKVDTRVSHYTKQVREKMHGIDTREAMARAEEISSVVSTEAKEISVETKGRQDILEQQFDDQIANMTLEDPSSAEIVAAQTNRKTGENWQTIGNRLDEENNRLTAELATLEQEKANADYVQTLINSVTGLGIKDVYYTYTALKTAFPQGTEGVFIVLNTDPDNPHKYAWSSTIADWVDLGPYQWDSIPDRTVTAKKTDFLNILQSVNLFNKNNITVGKYVRSSDGSLQTLAGYNVFETEGKPNTDYKTVYSSERAFYDSVGLYLGGTNLASFTTPANTAIIKLSVTDSNLNTEMLVEGTVLPTSYVPFEETIEMVSDIKLQKENLSKAGKFVDRENLSFTSSVTSINKFDKSKVTAGKYVRSSDGVLTALSGYNASDGIPVTPGKIQRTVFSSMRAYYDNNNVFISGTNASQTTAPSNASIIKISVTDANLEKEMLVEDIDLPTEYVPYAEYTVLSDIKFNYKDILDPPSSLGLRRWEGKKWVAIGDSITEWEYPDENGVMQRWSTLVSNKIQVGSLIRCAEHSRKMNEIDSIMTYSGTTEQNLIDAALITVSLGQNDRSTPLGTINDSASFDGSSFYGSTRGMIEYLLGLNPNCTLVFITPTPAKNYENVLREKSDAIKKMCELYSIPVLDLNRMSNFNTYNYDYFYTDGSTHPNGIGYKRMANITSAFLEAM